MTDREHDKEVVAELGRRGGAPHQEALEELLLDELERRYGSRRTGRRVALKRGSTIAAAALVAALAACAAPVTYSVRLGVEIHFALESEDEAPSPAIIEALSRAPGLRAGGLELTRDEQGRRRVRLVVVGDEEPVADAITRLKNDVGLEDTEVLVTSLDGSIEGTLIGRVTRDLNVLSLDAEEKERARAALLSRLERQDEGSSPGRGIRRER